MPNIIKTYNFTSDTEGFVVTHEGNSLGGWVSSGGNPTGHFVFSVLGRRDEGYPYIELTTTWETLGISAGSTITQINASSFDWRANEINVPDFEQYGPLEIRDSGSILQATLIASTQQSGTTTYATKNGGVVSIPAAIEASNSTIKIRLNCGVKVANNASAEAEIMLDTLVLDVQYDLPNLPPTIVANTADAVDFVIPALPLLEFTGTDPTSDDLEYVIELDTAPTFDANVQNIDNFPVEGNLKFGMYIQADINQEVGQCFTANAGNINEVSWHIRTIGAPTGPVFCRLSRTSHDTVDQHNVYGVDAHSYDSILATSNSILAENISTNWETVTWRFSTPHFANEDVGNWYYSVSIRFEGGNETNKVQVGGNQVGQVPPANHSGNQWANDDGTYTIESPSTDLIFYADRDAGFLIADSATGDTRFVNTVNGGDTQPFNSGEKISFEVNDLTLVDDQYDESNKNNWETLDGTVTRVGQSFKSQGGDLFNAKFSLAHRGTAPTGPVTAKLYAHSGTFGDGGVPTGAPLATSDTVEAANLGIQDTFITFNFPGGYTLVKDTVYFMVIDGVFDVTNYVEVWHDDTSSTHQGNRVTWSGSWVASPIDACFQINVISPLRPGTYYWRVKTIDPNGSNSYSANTPTRSFNVTEVAGAAPGMNINVGGAWKDMTAIKINVGGTWKVVQAVKVNIGGVWKPMITP